MLRQIRIGIASIFMMIASFFKLLMLAVAPDDMKDEFHDLV